MMKEKFNTFAREVHAWHLRHFGEEDTPHYDRFCVQLQSELRMAVRDKWTVEQFVQGFLL